MTPGPRRARAGLGGACGGATLVALALLAMLWRPGAAHGAEPPYVIGPEDVLEIQVWDNKELNQTVFVRPDGKTSLPLVGEVEAAGRTVLQFQEFLAGAYAAIVKDAKVTVIVREIKSRPVYFIGAFTKPGVTQLTRELTLLQAISLAGGLLPAADGDKGFLLRGATRLPIDFTQLIQKGETGQNLKLEPGDAIVAPVADAVYVHGEVKTPGPIKSTGDLTVLRAIAQAGGFTQMAAVSRVEILRGAGSKPERIRVDLDRIMKAPTENPDVSLKPNDVIFVPQRLF
jgi:polysaccharide export outer membrane protein